jgi:CRP/FNR family transcriptional regulator, nitrogen oxide reductase regulator
MASVDRSLVINLSMFAGLTPAEQDDLLGEARSVRYPKGSAVFEQGAEADRFFVLLHGHLRVEKTTPQGQQMVVRYVSAGELFGVAQAMNLSLSCDGGGGCR